MGKAKRGRKFIILPMSSLLKMEREQVWPLLPLLANRLPSHLPDGKCLFPHSSFLSSADSPSDFSILSSSFFRAWDAKSLPPTPKAMAPAV